MRPTPSRLTLAVLILTPISTAHVFSSPNAVVRIPSHGASGTIIHTQKDSTHILSCAHAFTEDMLQKPIVLNIPRAGTDIASLGRPTLLAVDYKRDLALIHLPAGPFEFSATVPDQNFQVPTQLLSVGFDRMRFPPQQVPTNLLSKEGPYWLTKERPWHGRSGGALLAKSKFLVAVVHGYECTPEGNTLPHHRGVYIGHKTILTFLAQNNYQHLIQRQKPNFNLQIQINPLPRH